MYRMSVAVPVLTDPALTPINARLALGAVMVPLTRGKVGSLMLHCFGVAARPRGGAARIGRCALGERERFSKLSWTKLRVGTASRLTAKMEKILLICMMPGLMVLEGEYKSNELYGNED